jgi:hypothetical protein
MKEKHMGNSRSMTYILLGQYTGGYVYASCCVKSQNYTLSRPKADTAIAGSRGNMLRQEDCSCDCPPSYFQHLDAVGKGGQG